ncbi:hypothetical protein AAT19DRAFT_10361 [Rhodotorula toruloides]|uniref:Uncharacterized protein n=1 Tax=Rhodotorula toruloides TaxID=5286 RepID=A0A2T0A0J8_RHOTO|nr:hypothetical protein AAT19DRAFT_10361 [Rhodotorula toruloides]
MSCRLDRDCRWTSTTPSLSLLSHTGFLHYSAAFLGDQSLRAVAGLFRASVVNLEPSSHLAQQHGADSERLVSSFSSSSAFHLSSQPDLVPFPAALLVPAYCIASMRYLTNQCVADPLGLSCANATGSLNHAVSPLSMRVLPRSRTHEEQLTSSGAADKPKAS